MLDRKIRMPILQRVGESIARNLQQTLMDDPAARRVIKTTAGNRIAKGPLPTLQRFTSPAQPNNAQEMASGSHKHNAPRVVNKSRGQSVGL